MIASNYSVMLIAHGSRVGAANAELVEIAELLRASTTYTNVEVAYLELASPSLPEAAQLCVDNGACQVFMMPYFLSAGSHVTRDLEAFRQQFSEQFADVEWILCQPLGVHPQMITIISDRLKQAVQPTTDDDINERA